MFKIILVPIDLAHLEKGKHSLEIARQIGAPDARIILVNVVEDVPTYLVAQLPHDMIDNAQANAEEELKAIARAAGITPDCEVRTGKPSSTILDVAEARHVDLIVIGAHKPDLQDYLIGSTASRVARHAKNSVLVVR